MHLRKPVSSCMVAHVVIDLCVTFSEIRNPTIKISSVLTTVRDIPAEAMRDVDIPAVLLIYKPYDKYTLTKGLCIAK